MCVTRCPPRAGRARQRLTASVGSRSQDVIACSGLSWCGCRGEVRACESSKTIKKSVKSYSARLQRSALLL